MPTHLHITQGPPVINLSGLSFENQARAYAETRQRAIETEKGIPCRFMMKEYVRLVTEDRLTGSWTAKSTWFALAS